MTTKSLRPETKYAKSGPVHIAYQVLGSGLLDLVLTALCSVLSAASLVLPPDQVRQKGYGTLRSCRGNLTLEERMDDVRAVMDAARTGPP